MKRPQNGSTPHQYAYATRRLNGDGSSKKEIALLSGYSMNVAENVKAKVEDTTGYKNAVIELAVKSNNLLLAAMTEFEARGLEGFSNAELTKALNAISGAWSHIEKHRAPDQMKTVEGNPLRGVFQRRVETQTVTIEPAPVTPKEEVKNTPTPVESIDLDF